MADQDLVTVERDLRLDLFRGIGLWMIFLDHIPHDVVSWLTLRNYGFSDAAEFFVFISGYLVGWIYTPIVRGGLFLAALKRLWTRAAQMYVAHIMLFLIFTAQIARTARRFDNPMYENEFNVFNFLQHPDVLIAQAITLRYFGGLTVAEIATSLGVSVATIERDCRLGRAWLHTQLRDGRSG